MSLLKGMKQCGIYAYKITPQALKRRSGKPGYFNRHISTIESKEERYDEYPLKHNVNVNGSLL